MIVARAPASTANLGPGFDAAAAALDLWNHVEIEEGSFAVEIDGEGADELPRDASHLAVRAFALLTPPTAYRFRFTNAIPLERGLGSSAAAIALGLVAGAAAAGRDVSADELLAAGFQLEGHADNLAAALNGGVCLSWNRNGAPHAARIADSMPAAAVLVVPSERTSTAESRDALPASVSHEDASVTAGAAALLSRAATPSCSGSPSPTACTSRTASPRRRCAPSPSSRRSARSASRSPAPARRSSSGCCPATRTTSPQSSLLPIPT
jgi:homoserine kinase